MTVREHILRELKKLHTTPLGYFRTSDIQELAYTGNEEFGRFLGSPGTYTREFRRMRTDGILKVTKLNRKSRQQIWSLERVGKTEDHLDNHVDYSDLPF